jgi:hypothetical protein
MIQDLYPDRRLRALFAEQLNVDKIPDRVWPHGRQLASVRACARGRDKWEDAGNALRALIRDMEAEPASSASRKVATKKHKVSKPADDALSEAVAAFAGIRYANYLDAWRSQWNGRPGTTAEASKWLRRLERSEMVRPDPNDESHAYDDPLLIHARADWQTKTGLATGPFESSVPISLPDGSYHVFFARRKNGYLVGLAGIVQHLASEFGWRRPEAAAFILCDRTPAVRRSIAKYDRNESIPALSRISLVLDPSLSPRDVMAIYTTERNKVFPGKAGGGGRLRPLGDQRTKLFLHCFRTPGTRSLPWPERMSAWNDAVDEKGRRYTRVDKFKEDAQGTIRHLLAPKDEGKQFHEIRGNTAQVSVTDDDGSRAIAADLEELGL